MSFAATFSLPAVRGRVRRVRGGLAARAAVQSAGAAVPLGASVKVKDAITVFHAPKHKAGLALQGVVGTVEKYNDLTEDGSALLSSTQPLTVRFSVPGPEGKPVSFVTHMTVEELEVVEGAPAGAAAAGAAGGAAAGGASAGGTGGGAFAAQLAAGDVVEVRAPVPAHRSACLRGGARGARVACARRGAVHR
jgi:hypothetical protein